MIGSARVMCDLKSGCERVQLDRTETETEREWTARIAAEFKKIGMPPHMLGHVYLCDAVVMSILLPKCMRQKMNQIYVVIGERFGTTPARVERNIRTVIKATWERALDREVLAGMFGESYRNSNPTNSEFVARMHLNLLLQ